MRKGPPFYANPFTNKELYEEVKDDPLALKIFWVLASGALIVVMIGAFIHLVTT